MASRLDEIRELLLKTLDEHPLEAGDDADAVDTSEPAPTAKLVAKKPCSRRVP